MWFGDLVTMKWWNGIWLNEAFATFMEMKCTDAFRPEWDRWTDFGISRVGGLRHRLRSHRTRPIEFEVVSPAEAEGMFDILTYEKGAAVVRMLEQYLGEDALPRRHPPLPGRAPVRQHRDHRPLGRPRGGHRRAGPPDHGQLDLPGRLPGRRRSTLADDGRTVRLAQETLPLPTPATMPTRPRRPALVDPGAAPYRRSRRHPAEHRVLLDGDRAEVALDGPIEWVVVNTGGSGFYRVRYSPDLLQALVGHRDAELAAVERYGLVDDAWAAVLAGDDRSGRVPRPWPGPSPTRPTCRCGSASSAASPRSTASCPRTTATTSGASSVRSPDRRSSGSATAADGEAERTAALRAALFEALGTIGADETVRARARAVVDAGWEHGPADPDLFDAAVRVVAAAGGEATFDEYLARADKAANPQDELRYLGALAGVPQPELLQRYLDLMLTDQVRSQDAPYLLRQVLADRDHARTAWDFVHREWSAMNERYPSNSIARLLDGVRTVSDPVARGRRRRLPRRAPGAPGRQDGRPAPRADARERRAGRARGRGPGRGAPLSVPPHRGGRPGLRGRGHHRAARVAARPARARSSCAAPVHRSSARPRPGPGPCVVDGPPSGHHHRPRGHPARRAARAGGGDHRTGPPRPGAGPHRDGERPPRRPAHLRAASRPSASAHGPTATRRRSAARAAALAEAIAWGAELVVVKGDLTDGGKRAEWDEAAAAPAAARRCRWSCCPGNHDLYRHAEIEPAEAGREHGLHVDRRRGARRPAGRARGAGGHGHPGTQPG